jgi:hypothetical protein
VQLAELLRRDLARRAHQQIHRLLVQSALRAPAEDASMGAMIFVTRFRWSPTGAGSSSRRMFCVIQIAAVGRPLSKAPTYSARIILNPRNYFMINYSDAELKLHELESVCGGSLESLCGGHPCSELKPDPRSVGLTNILPYKPPYSTWGFPFVEMDPK